MMKYPGGVSRNELEIRLRSLEAKMLRVLSQGQVDIQSAIVASATQVAGETLDAVTWDVVTGKPTTFPPDPHSHTLVSLDDVDAAGIQDGEALVYDEALATFVPGAAGRPGITYRTIPEGVTVEVLEGEQYLVFQELILEGELILDGGEVVVMSPPDSIPEFPVDAFGRVRVSDPVTIFDASHQYNLNPLVWDAGLTTGTGTVTHLPAESAVSLSTGGTLLGASAILQSKVYHRYQPGKSQLVKLTGGFGAAVENVRRRIGYFDANDGLFYEQTTAGVGVVLRSSTTGSVVDTRVEQADWNMDKLDGNGKSRLTIDFEKAQIFLVDFEWLSLGRVRFGIVLGGSIIYVHEFTHINQLTGAYMATANLPIRTEIENTGVAAGASTMKQICVSVISEGGQEDDRAYLFSGGNGTTTVPVTVTRRPVMTIRPSLLFNGLVNRAQVIPIEMDFYSDGNAEYEFVLNGALTGASFASMGGQSVSDIDVAATAIVGGTTVEGGYVTTAGGASRGQGRNGLLGRLPLVLNAVGDTADTITVVAKSFAGTVNLSARMTWREFR